MMDAIVQLIRNALCCVKDWEIGKDTPLYDPSNTQALLKGIFSFDLPEGLDKTTPLEVVISITQLYACVSCTKSGFQLAWKSAGKLKRIVRLLESRLSTAAPNGATSKTAIAANRIVNESLIKEAKSAMRNAFVGILVAPLGIAFFWLFANSWHITEVGWIGGIVALIDALTVMEICLVPLLYYMIVDGFGQLSSVQQTKKVIETVSSDKGFDPDYLNITRYEYMEPGWVPFFEEGASPLSSPSDTEAKQLEEETKQVEQTLGLWFAPSKDDGEKDAKIRKEALANSVERMQKSLFSLTTKGYREFLYFLLNFVAFYGYLMGIITFYYPEDDAQPSWVTQLKFGYGNQFADWSGNFAGDLMWTIEPAVILASPYYITVMAPTAKGKAKTD